MAPDRLWTAATNLQLRRAPAVNPDLTVLVRESSGAWIQLAELRIPYFD